MEAHATTYEVFLTKFKSYLVGVGVGRGRKASV